MFTSVTLSTWTDCGCITHETSRCCIQNEKCKDDGRQINGQTSQQDTYGPHGGKKGKASFGIISLEWLSAKNSGEVIHPRLKDPVWGRGCCMISTQCFAGMISFGTGTGHFADGNIDDSSDGFSTPELLAAWRSSWGDITASRKALVSLALLFLFKQC